MHALVPKDRVPAHSEPGGHVSRDGRDQTLALFAHAAGFEKLALRAPPHQLGARRVAAFEPGIQQLARLPFPGRRAAMGDDHVERVGFRNRSGEIDMAAQRLQISLHRARGSAGRPRGPIERGTDRPANAQRGVIHPDRLSPQEKRTIVEPRDGEIEVEPGSQVETVERPRRILAGPASQRDIERRARDQFVERDRLGNQLERAGTVAVGQARPREHAFQARPLTERRHQLLRGTLRRGSERADAIGRPHAPSGVRPERERLDRLAAVFVVALRRNRRRGDQGRKARPEQHRHRDQGDQRARLAQPARRTDRIAEIGHEYRTHRARVLVQGSACHVHGVIPVPSGTPCVALF